MSRGASDTVEIITHKTTPRDVIVLGIPTFGMVSIWFMSRVFGLRMPMNRIVRHVYVVGKEVGEARNEIVARALQIEQEDPTVRCSHVFFLDDDVLAHPEALVKLLSHKAPIMSGLYYAKASVPTPLVFAGEFTGTPQSWTPGDVVPCWGHGMGLTLIDADVFRRMRDTGTLGVDAAGYPNWFSTTRDAGLVTPDGAAGVFNQTEDIAFLRRAADLGYSPAVDTSAATFGWHWDQRGQVAYPLQQWHEFQTRGTITWQTDTGAHTWGTVAA
jgi:hypothetical protein